MSNAQPNSITNQLIERLSGYGVGDSPSEFELKLLENEAKKLRNTEIDSWWMIKGILAQYKGDITTTKKAYKKAYKKALVINNSATININYSRSLLFLGLFEQSYNALASTPYIDTNAEIIQEAYNRASLLGYLDEVLDYTSRLQKFYPEQHGQAQNIEQAKAFCDTLHISSDDFQATHKLMLSTLYDNEVLPKSIHYQLDPLDHSQLIVLFHVDTTAEVMSNTTWDFAGKLAEIENDAIMSNKLIALLKGVN